MSNNTTRWSNLGAAFKNRTGKGYTARIDGLPDTVVNGVEMKSMPMRFQIFIEKDKNGVQYLSFSSPHPNTGDVVEEKLEIPAEPNCKAQASEDNLPI